MRFGLGTPKVQTLAIADTGSDLTWIQCTPCKQCYKQKAPLFVPTRSSTYKPVPCHSDTCNSLDSASCNGDKGTCGYMISYGDRSHSSGEVATETVTLGNNVTLPRVIIGCGHNDLGTFNDETSGIVGLGGGKESLIRQMGPSIRGKFSYCLTQLEARATKPSKMHFGSQAMVSGAGVATTSIVAKSPATYYYLTLQGMSVGSQRFHLDSWSYDHESKKLQGREGNIIIDSGTTLTYLPSELYRQVEAAVRRQVKLEPVQSELEQLSLCYAATEDVEKHAPEITAHFKGADVKLKHYNTFVRLSEKSVCFAFTPSSSLAIYGNIAQMDFLIGYDLEKKTVSFKPTDCSSN